MAEDAIAALNFLQKESRAVNIIILGICSGGNVGIGILDRVESVKGMFLLSVYPFGEADSFGKDARRSLHYLKEYWYKLFMRETWKKFVSGKINFGSVFRIIFKPLLKSKAAGEPDDKSGESSTSPLENLLRQKPQLQMIYGDADPEFKASMAYYEKFKEANAYPMSFNIIKGANHNFYAIRWKTEIAQSLRQFIKEL